jgi:beta-fructofuranosidase
VRLVLGGEPVTIWEGTVTDGEELRIMLDASIVEVYRSGGVPTTLRAYPAEGDSYALELGGGVAARAWELAVPSLDA